MTVEGLGPPGAFCSLGSSAGEFTRTGPGLLFSTWCFCRFSYLSFSVSEVHHLTLFTRSRICPAQDRILDQPGCLPLSIFAGKYTLGIHFNRPPRSCHRPGLSQDWADECVAALLRRGFRESRMQERGLLLGKLGCGGHRQGG